MSGELLHEGAGAGRFNPYFAAKAFQASRGRVIHLDDGFYLFDKALGYYLRFSKHQFFDEVNAWLGRDAAWKHYTTSAYHAVRRDGYVKQTLLSLKSCHYAKLTPPFFLNSSSSADGWVVLRNGRLNVRKAAEFYVFNRRLPSLHHPHTSAFAPNDDALVTCSSLDIDWSPESTCPEFESFLRAILPDDGARETIQMQAGLIVSGDKRFKCFFTWSGPTNTGKSTLKRILAGVLGAANVSSLSWEDIDRQDRLNELVHVLVNFNDDPRSLPTRKQQAALKSLCDAGTRIAEKVLYEGTTEREVTALWCNILNDRQEIHWGDPALQGRERLVRFTEQFGTPGRPPCEAGLEERILEEERDAIFAWAVAGYGKLLARNMGARHEGFPILGEAREELDAMAVEEDPRFPFLRENYKLERGAVVPSATVHQAWVVHLSKSGLLDRDEDDEDAKRIRNELLDRKRLAAAIRTIFLLRPVHTNTGSVFRGLAQIDSGASPQGKSSEENR